MTVGLSDLVVRPIVPEDGAALMALAESLGPGMTTLPADRGVLQRKAENSKASFRNETCDEVQYLLGLCELCAPQRLLGVAGIYPNVGEKYGFFSYRIGSLVQRSRLNDKAANIQVLSIDNGYTGATEVGSLAVHPRLRGRGAGKLLAKARYMLIAAAPDRFGARIMAEMRGWQDEEDRSPFWDAVGRKFFDVDFAVADRLSAIEGAAYFADLWPKLPIYSALLPNSARRAIGRAHSASQLALDMLVSEGFVFDGMVDLFDAGPQVSANVGDIATIRDSRCVLAGELPEETALVSTIELSDFRVWLGPAKGASAALRAGSADQVRSAGWN
ncbi:MAG: arginine N-succinyltransferase [Terricaulis sp.]